MMGYRDTERLGGLEVYDHLEFCRKLHREIQSCGRGIDYGLVADHTVVSKKPPGSLAF